MNAYTLTRTPNEQRNAAAMSASSPSRHGIDVGRYVTKFQRILGANGDWSARTKALEILRRWQFDDMLDAASRQRARLLFLKFSRNR
jgi:hypothetical protein